MLHKHGGYVHKVLQRLFPEHEWIPHRFERVPTGYWDVVENQRKFLDEIGLELGISGKDGWYKVISTDIVKCGGSSLLHKYGGSMSKMLQNVYSEDKWDVWRFERVSKDYWEHFGSLTEFVEWVGKRLGVRGLEDWYRISFGQIQKVVPVTAFRKLTMEKILVEAYPEHGWDVGKLKARRGNMKASQRMLAVVLGELFPDCGNVFTDWVT